MTEKTRRWQDRLAEETVDAYLKARERRKNNPTRKNCSVCHGSGWVWDTSYPRANDGEQQISCWFCKGTGKK